MRSLLAPALLLAGCTFSASYGHTSYQCGADETCPAGQTCVAGLCEGGPGSSDAASTAGADARITDAPGGGDAGGPDAPTCGGDVTCSIDLLVDPFDGDAPSALWNPYADPGSTLSVAGGSLHLVYDGTGAFAGLDSAARYDLSIGSIVIDSAGLPQQASFVSYLQATDPGGDGFEIQDVASSLRFNVLSAGTSQNLVSLTYGAADRFWRLRGDGSTTVHFDTSPDGATWTSRVTTTATSDLTRIRINLGAGYLASGQPAVTAAIPGVNAP